MKKTKQIIQTSQNYEYTDHAGEKLSGNSMTIPDESYTIREILEKFTMGYDIPRKHPQYSNTDDFDDVDPTAAPDFDLADVTMERARILEEIEERRARKQKVVKQAVNEAGQGDGSVADGAQPADV